MFKALKHKFINGLRSIIYEILKIWLQIIPHPCLTAFTYKYIQKSSPVNVLSSGQPVKLCCKLLAAQRFDFVNSTLNIIVCCQMKPMNDFFITLMHLVILV